MRLNQLLLRYWLFFYDSLTFHMYYDDWLAHVCHTGTSRRWRHARRQGRLQPPYAVRADPSPLPHLQPRPHQHPTVYRWSHMFRKRLSLDSLSTRRWEAQCSASQSWWSDPGYCWPSGWCALMFSRCVTHLYMKPLNKISRWNQSFLEWDKYIAAIFNNFNFS